MQYKTIALGLIQEQPELYESLRSSKRLLPAMDAHAIDLREIHHAMMNRFGEANPGLDSATITSVALEMAIEQMRDRLLSASPASEPPSLDEAMNYVRSAMPTA